MERITITQLNDIDLQNKIICFPTDTVYGVGALPDDQKAIAKIYQMKKRIANKPLPILCWAIDDVKKIVDIPSNVMPILTKYWPGALTVIMNKKDNVYNETYDKTIAVRIPDCDVALTILKHFGPLATTSVNYSGEDELSSLDEIEQLFGDIIDYAITDSVIFSSIPSTIITATPTLKVIRQGTIKIN